MIGIPTTEEKMTPQGYWCKMVNGDTVIPGDLVCYDHDNAVEANRHRVVEQPATANLAHFAGVIKAVGPLDEAGERRVEVIPPSFVTLHGFSLNTDEDVSVGDFLGPQDGSYKAGEIAAGGFRNAYFRATIAVDRSGTAGPVVGQYGSDMKLFRMA